MTAARSLPDHPTKDCVSLFDVLPAASKCKTDLLGERQPLATGDEQVPKLPP